VLLRRRDSQATAIKPASIRTLVSGSGTAVTLLKEKTKSL